MKSKTRSLKSLPNGETIFSQVEFSFGDVNNQNLDIHDMRWKESSQDIRTTFKDALGLERSSWFVSTVLRLQASFFRNGFKLVPTSLKS